MKVKTVKTLYVDIWAFDWFLRQKTHLHFVNISLPCANLCINQIEHHIQKLQRIQNNAARIVIQAPRRSDVNSLLQTLHCLPVEQRINYSWPCWRSRLCRRHLRSIWISTSRCAPVHSTLDRRPSHCCTCHFDGHHLPDNLSALPHLWLGTHCHLPY